MVGLFPLAFLVEIPVDHILLSSAHELIQIFSRLSFLLLVWHVQNRLLVCLSRSEGRCCNSHYGS